MRFVFVALAASQSLAMRPEVGREPMLASLGDIMSKISSPKDTLSALNEASSAISIMMEGPVDDHISDADRQLLSSVVDLIDNTIYSSMDDSHNADVAELDAAIKAAQSCNADIALRQSPQGDLGILNASVHDKQLELNRLQGIVNETNTTNNTKWEEFELHMLMISPSPACPDMPARTNAALDVFFEDSEYLVWFTAQQASYKNVRDAWVAADAALGNATQAYDIQKAVRNVQYCDWKAELEAACAAFDTCFSEKSDFYTETLVPRVTSDMNSRIDVKKAGDTLIHQINFLLGDAAQQDTPAIDTSRYQIEFPTLPLKGECDLAPLDSHEWVPAVTCSKASDYVRGAAIEWTQSNSSCTQALADGGIKSTCGSWGSSDDTSSNVVILNTTNMSATRGIEFTFKETASGECAIGLGCDNLRWRQNRDPSVCQFVVYYALGGESNRFYIWEKGVGQSHIGSANPDFGADVWQVRVNDAGLVEYVRNGEVWRTSKALPEYPLYAKFHSSSLRGTVQTAHLLLKK